jgi:hypothetical protein
MKNNEINGTTITALEVDTPELVKMMNDHAIMTARIYETALMFKLENTQEFINWQDHLNEYSLLPPEEE